ncbi:MAG: DUF4349 domain-containing protein [Dehalococcoidia bacterium]|nr:DUF4349 domain-containing protein [Dehalococcoidia bacterium]
MKTKLMILVCTVALLLVATALACGAGADEASQTWSRQTGDMEVVEETAALRAAPAPAAASAPAAAGLPGSPGQAVAAVVKEVAVEKQVLKEVELSAPMSAALSGDDAQTQAQAQLVTQRRIIIRTVNMVIVVDEIQDAIDDISLLADTMGGWVVSTDRREKHSGVISLRVLAANLDLTIEELRELAKDVESEVSTSQDVTDEYFDLQSRLKNQQATEDALIRLLDRADSVEHALAVQRELSSVQENVERLLGRIKLLEETSAFSLITVNLKLAPVDMSVDAGPDQSVAAYTPIRFRATFTPPEGMDSHVVTWDFGDGSEPVIIVRSAPTTDEGERVTATVTHEYGDPKDSPFIAQVDINSFGEGGVAEGEDTLIVSVSETPVIEVFAGERDYRVLQNEVVEFSGSFTRPPGLSNVRYQWDFGDGSPPEEGEVAEDITRVDTTHAYPDYRSTRYNVKFTITADSAVGEIVASHEIRVRVDEDPGLIVGGFDVGDNAKTAVRTLSLVLSGLTMVVVWVGIFGIIWVPLVVVVVILVRRGRRFRTEHPAGDASRPTPQDEPGPGIA